VKTNREKFEATISASPYEKSVARWPDLPVKFAWPGGYKDLVVDLAWHMWQASRKQALDEAIHVCGRQIPIACSTSMVDVARNQGIRACVEAVEQLGKEAS